VATGKITLLIDHFSALISTLNEGRRHPALETLLYRGRPSNHGCSSADALRFKLFGFAPEASQPVAALTRIADRGSKTNDKAYWLRLDPVTLWADMARVIMARCGFADLDEQERDEVENTVRSVLFREGITLNSDHPERWTIALERSLQFDFTPLEDAHGMDVAEVLPDHPAALHWGRIMNEIQMALHACPVNVRRRQQGRVEINSVWFWGGGLMPAAVSEPSYRTVCADHPVTRGLALLHDCTLHHLSAAEFADFSEDGGDVLLDWSRPVTNPDGELQLLNHIAGRLLEQVKLHAASIYLCTPDGAGWLFDRRCMRRWWKRREPLANYRKNETE
jgi:hypothetical protein